ncbi:unnamed protein product [Schistosoma mattheei]|uniref:Uncharacterized protein n=1 Tax=Schistosoma mattheei TaxID=31246 RepID=A0AA85C0T5_9TREM|nr:unnamed protein product [Schistosoma mattheei]
MKTGLFSNKYIQSHLNLIIELFQQLVHDNLEEITITNLDFNETNTTTTTIMDTDNHDPHQHSNTITGWYQPQSKLLEPRWKYLELHDEPKREYHSLITQSGLKQSYLLVCCGLSLFIGLIRYQWLKQDQLNHLQLLNQFLPSIITCLQSKYIQVLNITIKSLLVNHQSNYPLSKLQLLTLLNIVDIELNHNQNESMNSSLTLFNAILKRRLRDPIIQTNQNDFFNFIKDPQLLINNEGLIIAKLSDHNYDLKLVVVVDNVY